MRLLQQCLDGSLKLLSVPDDRPPPFAILSHTWGDDDDEITYKDINGIDLAGQACLKSKIGYKKLDFCLKQAARDGLELVWVDTCCIDKDSQTETNRAINWMFRWYAAAEKCYVYMADVCKHKRRHSEAHDSPKWQDDFKDSRWFKRGWTLQELLAPSVLEFFSREGELLGTKNELADTIEMITGIDMLAIRGKALAAYTTQQRFDWAEGRETKEPEDRVYSLFGVLNVSFPPNYGEGQQNAMKRLRAALVEEYAGQLLILDFHQGYQRSDRIRNVVSIPGTHLNRVNESRLKTLAKALEYEHQDVRRSNIKQQTAKTCEWLLEHDVWRAWRSAEPGSHLIWIKGKPGTGKSTIMKFAEVCTAATCEDEEVVISFYFNARGSVLERCVEGMYRSLSCQLVNALSSDELRRAEQALRTVKLPVSNKSWPVDLLQIFFAALTSSLQTRRLFIFVDALDECKDDEVREMLFFLEDLGLGALEQKKKVSICFASRYYPAVVLDSAVELRLDDEPGHARDLEQHVAKTLNVGKDERARFIQTQLLANSNGSFIWAVSVVPMINDDYASGGVAAISSTLDHLPSNVSVLFQRITQRDNVHIDQLALSLQWILFSNGSLSPKFFYALMLAGDGGELLMSEITMTDDDFKRYVSYTTKGLAEVILDRVQFVHETVRDFLLQDGGLASLWKFDGDVKSSNHDRLKQICVRRLQVVEEDGVPRKSMMHFDWNSHRVELTDWVTAYAFDSMIVHAEAAAEHISQQAFLQNCSDLWQRWDLPGVTDQADADHHTLGLLIEASAVQLVRAFLSMSKIDLEKKADDYLQRSLLLAACDESPTTAYDTTAREKRLIIVQALLDAGADPNSTDMYGDTALHIAVKYPASLELIEALLIKNANPAARNEAGQTPLDDAVARDDVEIFKLITTRVKDPSAMTLMSGTYLHLAAEAGAKDILMMLLRSGESPSTPTYVRYTPRNDMGYTPLHCAVAGSDRETYHTTKVLLDHLADVDARDRWGRTALMLAVSARENNAAKMSLLLSAGADICITDANGYSSLMHAVESAFSYDHLLILFQSCDKTKSGRIMTTCAAAQTLAQNSTHYIHQRNGIIELLRTASSALAM